MPILLLVLLLATATPTVVLPPEAVQDCRDATARLASGLIAELTKAMTDGGATAALSVCREKAPAIAAAVSKEKGLTVRRTALKVRNSENRPDAWETEVLKEFEGRLAGGEDPASIERFDLTEAGGKQVLRYMKAIPTKEFCLQCHGDPAAMKPAVKAAVAKLYPNDAAVGFKAGNLRGAFSVKHISPIKMP